MIEPVYLGICGVSNIPGAIDGWTDNFSQACIDRGLLSDRFEYFTTPITRFIRQRGRIKDLQTLIGRYSGHPLHLIAHSNGCQLVCEVLKRSSLDGATLDLFSPACEASFEKNGLNQSLADRRVSRVTVHWGGKDRAMWFAKLSQKAFGWMGLGFGTLGLTGPQAVRTELQDRVTAHFEPTFGHSTWFTPEHFEETMNNILPQPQPQS